MTLSLSRAHFAPFDLPGCYSRATSHRSVEPMVCSVYACERVPYIFVFTTARPGVAKAPADAVPKRFQYGIRDDRGTARSMTQNQYIFCTFCSAWSPKSPSQWVETEQAQAAATTAHYTRV